MVDPTVLSRTSLQHVRLCALLYEQMARVAAKGVRSAFLEAMSEEATSDLLCWSMEKGLGQGAAQGEHLHACARVVLAAAAVRAAKC